MVAPQDLIAALSRQNLDESRRVARRSAAIQVAEFDAIHVEVLRSLLEVRFALTDTRNLGVGISTVRDNELGGTRRRCEQRVLNNDTGLCVGVMRELLSGTNVTGRENSRVTRTQSMVHADEPCRRGDADGVQIEALDVRASTRRDKNPVCGYLRVRAMHRHFGIVARNTRDGRA
jgi:hypothetical protein